MTPLKAALVMLLLTAPAWGAEQPEIKPVLSPLGVKRAEENLKILEQNIRDMKSNMETAERNVQTLRSEIADLEKLNEEHQEMRKRCQEYLSSAQVQIVKNDAEIKKAKQNERNLAQASGGDKKEKMVQMEKVKRDQAELDNWKGDAQEKTRRVKELLGEITEGERQLEVRKASLRGQIKNWEERKSEFSAQVDKFILRRAEVERLTKK